MKIYRYVARAGRQKTMHGIFRGLDFEKAHIPEGEYEELMSFINQELPVPNRLQNSKIITKQAKFWFTEKGYHLFSKYIAELLAAYDKYSPNYIKEWDILQEEIPDDDAKIVYQDYYQIVLIQ